MSRIEEQIKNLSIPYPQRHLLELEIMQDLAHRAGEDPTFSREDVAALEELHETRALRFLKRFGASRRTIETFLAFLPLVMGVLLIKQEKEMISFIREGGVGMYGILAIGILLLGREVLNAVRLLVIRDHSTQNLRIDTPSVLLGCLGLMLASLGSAILGLYVAADGVMKAHLSYDFLIAGAKESMTNIVLSSFLCALIILAHYGTRRALCVWRAPI